MNEDMNKFPTNSYTRKQAPFRSSFRKNVTRDTYQDSTKPQKKTKSKLLDETPFEEKLDLSIKENTISLINPEVLLTINYDNGDTTENTDETEITTETIKNEIKNEYKNYEKYIKLLEQSATEDQALLFESMIENVNARIEFLTKMIDDENNR